MARTQTQVGARTRRLEDGGNGLSYKRFACRPCSSANTVPTTLAGLTAYLDYVVSESKDGELHFEPGDDQIDFVRSVARSVKQIVAA